MVVISDAMVFVGTIQCNSKIQLLARPMILEDDSNQNEFERADQFIDIHVSQPSRDQTLISKRYQLSTHEQDDDFNHKTPDFLQANPILPPGKHHIRQEPAFRLKFMSHRDKFNKTSFTQMAAQNRKNKLSTISVDQTKSKNNCFGEEAEQAEQEDLEFKALLQNRILVYRRYNFAKYNTLGKDRLLCSLFIESRKESHQSKAQPIYEYISKTTKSKSGKLNSDDWLCFNSCFQSGNLLMALADGKQSMPTYQLYMQNDVNTKGCTQWFYFSVENKTKGKAKFSLMNFYKPTSLYQRGMKVLCSQDGFEWRRTGTAITYSQSSQQKGQYALSFIHQFQQPGKITYFSYGYPYNYSNHLFSFVQNICSDQRLLKIVHKTNLCYSAQGNPIPILTITTPSTPAKKQNKPLIYIIGRQHPGETPASFIVEGLINLLLSSSQEAKELRDKFQFKIVPMVNVDGVVSGNYRSNISGSDVNRQWQYPSKRSHPQIYWIKQQINNNRKQAAFFLDIHAHSRKMNSFFYGSKATQRDSKLFPFICSKLNKFISYTESSFTDDPSKKTTARVILQSELQIPHSLTFQVSFYGYYDAVKGTNYSFKQSDLRTIGESLALGFYYYFIGIDKAKKTEEIKITALPKCISEKEKALIKNSAKILEKWNKELQKQNENQQVFSEGSQIDPQHFQLKQEERQFITQIGKGQKDKKSGQQLVKNSLSLPKEQSSAYSKNKLIIYSTLSPQLNDSKLLAPKGDSAEHLGISGNEFYHFSAHSKKDNKFSVRQLQLQLQLAGEQAPEKKLRGMRLKMSNNRTLADRQSLLQGFQSQRKKNYKQDVLQMKKALKYLLQSKSSDMEQYKSCFRSFTNELMSATLYRQNKRVYKL